MRSYTSRYNDEALRAARILSKENNLLLTWLCTKVTYKDTYRPVTGPKVLHVGQVCTNSFRAGVIATNVDKLKEDCTDTEYNRYRMIGYRALDVLEKEGFVHLHRVKSIKGTPGWTVVTVKSIINAVFIPETKDSSSDAENAVTERSVKVVNNQGLTPTSTVNLYTSQKTIRTASVNKPTSSNGVTEDAHTSLNKVMNKEDLLRLADDITGTKNLICFKDLVEDGVWDIAERFVGDDIDDDTLNEARGSVYDVVKHLEIAIQQSYYQ